MATQHTEARSILLIEDDPDDRGRIHRLLKGAGRSYRIVDAETGAEGIRLVKAGDRRFDCVLLDYHLPDMDGLELLHQIRGRTMPVAVSVLTGRDDDLLAAQAIEAGAEDYLLKDGLTAQALARSIENVVERFEIRRQLEGQRAAVELRNQRLELARDELQVKVAELAAATQARDRFMAMMSHEMRTPLNAILGYAELLELEIDGQLGETQRRHLDRIRVGSRHLLDLINDVLDLARADADKLDLDVRPVDITAVLDEVHALLEHQAHQRSLELVVTESTGVPPVLADLQRLRQILMNLVGNAVKFTDHGSVRVAASLAPDGRHVNIVVSDTGIGMDADVMSQAFSEFYQADSNLTRQYGGSGLGLAISRRLARAMGGEIDVASEPGRGSTFTLSMPAATGESVLRPEDVARHGARMAIHAATSDRATKESTAVSVAAFGDDAAALAALALQVSPAVHLVWTTDAAELPALAERERVSLVILDASSKGGGALRVAHALSELPPERVPAILLLPTIVAAAETTGTAVDLGWVALVPKPFTAQQLTRAVTTAAGRSEEAATEATRSVDVLVIDDDEDSRRVAAKFLSEHAIRVRECRDGETGLAEMRLRPPDVVVLDLMMPVLDGFGVLAAMRADPLIAGIPVVVLTAKSLTEAERQFLSRTVVRVLQKGEHRLADIAALVLRAAMRARTTDAVSPLK
jgi:signal transduction histidine kinase